MNPDTLFERYDHIEWMIDRMWNMEFLADQAEGIMQPGLSREFWAQLNRYGTIFIPH